MSYLVSSKRRSTLWLPLGVSLALTPLCLWLGIESGGGGHGDYLLAKLLFPWTMVSTLFFDSITTPFIALAVIQYPAYWVVLGFANRNGRLLVSATGLLAIHGLLVAASLLLPSQNF